MTKAARLFFLTLFLAAPLAQAAEPRVAMKSHLAKARRQWTQLDRVPANEAVELSLVVQLDQHQLDQALAEMYGPGSPKRKHYLSSQEFAQKFGLAEKRKRLKDFARANGLTINTAEDKDASVSVKVSGPANRVENAFTVQLHHFRGKDGKVFRSHDTDPTVPTSLAPDLNAILGLSNEMGQWKPALQYARTPLRKAGPAAAGSPTPAFSGTGPLGAISPTDIKTIYHFDNVTLDGSGQSVALLEFDGFLPSDLGNYAANFGLPNAPVTFVSVNGSANLCFGTLPCDMQTLQQETNAGIFGMGEVALDIDMVQALAPNVSQILVYEGGQNSNQGFYDIFNKMATDNTANVVSVSWLIAEAYLSPADLNAEAQVLQRMALQGQTVYACSGDWGDHSSGPGSPLGVIDPASQPFVTAVGGTELSGSAGTATEVSWNSSGGGISGYWGIPATQVGVSGTASQVFRNVPDVALNSSPASPYSIYLGGTWWWAYGTSAAAPLWGAFTALVNQQRAIAGNGPLGFANPVLYQLGASPAYHNLFNDITSGSNGLYSAGPGYDNVTGLGSFKGSALLDALAPGNFPPVISGIPAQFIAAGQFFSYQIAATHNPTSFGATGLPAGVAVNTITGLISGTPTTAGTTNVTLSATNGSGTGSASVVLTVTGGTPHIVVTKSANVATAVPGGMITYTIHFQNTGDGNAIGPVISDVLPAGVTLVPGSISDGGTLAANTITWNPGNLAPGAAGAFSFQVQVNP